MDEDYRRASTLAWERETLIFSIAFLSAVVRMYYRFLPVSANKPPKKEARLGKE